MTRLSAVCSLIEPANVIADVGCDHGLVAKYCLDNALCTTVIASDISDKCLEKAKKALCEYKNIRFVCCNGIDYDCDEAIIAGMGGLNIADILKSGRCKPKTLVLCPHRDADSVRRTAAGLGYIIDSDFMTIDKGRFYSVIRARLSDKEAEYSELQYMYGVFCDRKNEILKTYLNKLYGTYSIAPRENAEKLASIRAALALTGDAPTI